MQTAETLAGELVPLLNPTIVLVAPAGVLFECLARALEERLAGCRTQLCDLSGAGSGSVVRLILVHAEKATSSEWRSIAAYRTEHPEAPLAILVDDVHSISKQHEDLFAEQEVQGILPMTLKMEVWLAAVSLLLSGGEYYPVPSRQKPPCARDDTADVASASATVDTGVPRPVAHGNGLALTAREQQIWALLSEGHQNKLIAHKMSLSEHTVKVHVHNLLSKLRVTNRTQAAAAFRGRVEALRATPLERARAGHSSNGAVSH